jgi:hypothetical protein
MTPDEFFTIEDQRQLASFSQALQALWWCHRKEWDRAHNIAQEDPTRDGSWVHAHLHRVEGDLANAGYWYRRAGRPVCKEPLDTERRAMVAELLT